MKKAPELQPYRQEVINLAKPPDVLRWGVGSASSLSAPGKPREKLRIITAVVSLVKVKRCRKENLSGNRPQARLQLST